MNHCLVQESIPVASEGNLGDGALLAGAGTCPRTEVYGGGRLLRRIGMVVLSLTWWLLTLFGRLGRSRAIVLCYHSVAERQRSRFERQMQSIAGRASAVVWFSGRRSPPAVCVTFDDAFACLLTQALPNARTLGIPVCIFAVTGNLGTKPRWTMRPGHPEADERLMDADELVRAEREFGARIGSHTCSHRALSGLSAADLERELCDSKAALERLMGRSVRDLAIPYGEYNDGVLKAARRAGYDRTFTLDRTLRPRPEDPAVIGRYLMSPDTWALEFYLTVNGGYSWVFGAQRLWRRLCAPRGYEVAAIRKTA